MKTTASVAFSTARDSFRAGAEMSSSALISGIHELESPNLLPFYDSSRSDSGAASPFFQATPILAGIHLGTKRF